MAGRSAPCVLRAKSITRPTRPDAAGSVQEARLNAEEVMQEGAAAVRGWEENVARAST